MIYFDHAATSLSPNDDVIKAFVGVLKEYPANLSSSHRLGYLANKKLEEVRQNVKHLFRLNDDYEVIFNSGASEGITHALLGYAYQNRGRGNEIIAFKNEHPAVLENLKVLAADGFKITYLPAKNDGSYNLDDLKKAINKNTIMVVLMAVNNEVGSVNDLLGANAVIKNYPKCVLFSDVTQAVGKIDLNYSLLDVFACSAHKFGGLVGSGILVKKKKILLKKLINGGAQENHYRSGTTSLPLAYSTSVALNKTMKELKNNYQYVKKLHDELIKELKTIDEISINSVTDFPYIVNFSLKHKKASVVIEALSSHAIYVSSLSACNTKSNIVSFVLTNMGKDKQLAENSIRVSFNVSNTLIEVKTFVRTLKDILEHIR